MESIKALKDITGTQTNRSNYGTALVTQRGGWTLGEIRDHAGLMSTAPRMAAPRDEAERGTSSRT